MNPKVSFIVPVRNDAARLECCLRSILLNRQTPDQLEIVVVDNDSTDHSLEVAKRYGARVFTVSAARVALLRNYGASQAKGDVFAFIDADNEIAGGWMYAALDCLRMPQVGAAGALYQAPADGTWVQRTYGHLRGGPRDHRDANWLGSGNLAVTRSAFELVGGFDTELDTCEDVDFCHRLRRRGLRIVSDSRLKSVHHGDPKTLWEVLTSERWRGRDNLRVSFRRPISWAAVPSAVMPLVQTLLIALALIALGVLTRNVTLGALLLGTAVAGFCGASAIRVVRAALRGAPHRWIGVLPAFVVAAVFDMGRALALISRAPHRATRTRAAAVSS
jgi:GT2 family glycosyltransferase